jgi:tripartite-type tricarboxylate transporter receptor subunit TctC
MRAHFRCLAALLLPIAAALYPADAFPQAAYPARAIRLVAPVPPGSPPDVVARLVAQPLARDFGEPVVVENRAGGNQTIGLGAVAGAKPDGYTLGMVSLPSAVVPNLMAHMPYDTLRDFTPVREVAWTSNVLVVRAQGPIGSVADLVHAARAHPGRITFASGGNGTPAHVLGELFREQTGIDVLHVPFRGAVEGVSSVMAGDVDFMIASAGAVAPYVRAGKLAALAQTTETRLPLFRDVATFGELGFPGIIVRDWQGIVAPAGTPAIVLKRLSDAIRIALESPEMQERLAALGMEPVLDSSPGQFAAFMDSEVKRWAAVSKRSGLQAQ